MNLDRAARWVSIVGHPFVTVAAMVMARAAPATGLAFVLIAIVPVALVMLVQVWRGKWEHVDASNRRERPLLYAAGLAALLAAFGYQAMTHPGGGELNRGVAITLGMLLIFAIVMRWVKISLHVAFAALAATTLLFARSPAGWVIAALVPALIWSRLRLRRHTPAEVVLGLIGGVAAGLLIQLT